jgi:hypothetical protein
MADFRQQLALQRRLTHHYVPGWAGEDEWQSVGGYSLLRTRTIPGGDWESWGWSNTVRVDASPGAGKLDIERALLDTFAWGCRCEHDCCGHVQGAAHKAVHIKGREWVVHGRSSRNV